MNNSVIKGAIMLALTSLIGLLTNLPTDGNTWTVALLTIGGSMLFYFGQSKLFPTTSESGQINGLDVVKGLIVSAGNGISAYVATLVAGTPVHWGKLGISIAVLFVGYLIKQGGTTAK